MRPFNGCVLYGLVIRGEVLETTLSLEEAEYLLEYEYPIGAELWLVRTPTLYLMDSEVLNSLCEDYCLWVSGNDNEWVDEKLEELSKDSLKELASAVQELVEHWGIDNKLNTYYTFIKKLAKKE